MHRLTIYSLFILLAFSPLCKAQQSAVLHFSWPMDIKQQSNHLAYTPANNTQDLSAENSKQIVSLTFYMKEIKYALPKGAIFCRMEDALHQRFNIWLKFRMGSEDKYSD
ncbi:MAG TPA: hypothetical protein VNZ45_10050 [Bacteroidia bacterium]|nr:hypothetical protein [Bacteroidia bacterium]